jgi:hypothetical protein
VYSLAHLDSGQEQEGTQFPICSTPDAFNQAADQNPRNRGCLLRGVGPAHIAAIKALQPDNNRNLDPRWLAQLQGLSNPDKQTRSITTWPIPGAFTDRMKVQFTASRFISLGDADKTPLIPTLDSLRSHVAETLGEFAPCFKGQCPH